MIDILQTSITGDLLIQNGDLVLGESNTQNVFDLINSAPGEFKQYPSIGLGINSYLNANVDETSLTQKIQIQLNGDGFNTQKMIVSFDNTNDTETIDVSGVTR